MLTRREILHKCAALGAVVVASAFSPEAMLAAFQDREKEVRKPTPPNTLGPFDTRGDIVPGATIEIWQTNHQGYYDLDGYRYRGKLQVEKSGTYSFESVIPGHYPDKSRVCQHVHYVVSAPGHKTLVNSTLFRYRSRL